MFCFKVQRGSDYCPYFLELAVEFCNVNFENFERFASKKLNADHCYAPLISVIS